MPKNKVLEGAEAEICQVGVVVKDLDRTIEYLSSLGLGPFSVRTSTHPAAIVHGKKAFYQLRIAHSQQGPVQLELIEYQKGESIYKEFLEQKGEGLHHILFKVRDINATVDRFAQMGIDALLRDRFVEGGGIAYVDTGKIGGIITEIAQLPPNFDPKVGGRYQE